MLGSLSLFSVAHDTSWKLFVSRQNQTKSNHNSQQRTNPSPMQDVPSRPGVGGGGGGGGGGGPDARRPRSVFRVPSERVHLGKIAQHVTLNSEQSVKEVIYSSAATDYSSRPLTALGFITTHQRACRTCDLDEVPGLNQRLLNMLDFFLLSRSKVYANAGVCV